MSSRFEGVDLTATGSPAYHSAALQKYTSMATSIGFSPAGGLSVRRSVISS